MAQVIDKVVVDLAIDPDFESKIRCIVREEMARQREIDTQAIIATVEAVSERMNKRIAMLGR